MITKSATVGGLSVTPDELSLINQHTIEPITVEDIFVFKIALCDNEVDREFEVFPRTSLEKLAELFIGKTIIKDHSNKADNQVARIYNTMLLEGANLTKNNERYTQLIAHCYMLRTDTNKDLIAEIGAGIKKEVSVSCGANSIVCSICGTDQKKQYCRHYNGITYDGKECYFKVLDIYDAYEVSFVAVPVQQQAGVVKSYGEKPLNRLELEEKIKHLDISLAVAEAYINEKENKHD